MFTFFKLGFSIIEIVHNKNNILCKTLHIITNPLFAVRAVIEGDKNQSGLWPSSCGLLAEYLLL